MAHCARLSDLVVGGILAADIQEGRPVQFSNSGVVNGFMNDLPILVAAADNATGNVGVVMAEPNNLPRPIDNRQLTAGWYARVTRASGDFAEPVQTLTQYEIGPSSFYDPTLKSGWRAQFHQGATVTVGTNAFTDSSNIHVPGAKVQVTSGKWAYTSGANAVGHVDFYNAATSELTIVVWQ